LDVRKHFSVIRISPSLKQIVHEMYRKLGTSTVRSNTYIRHLLLWREAGLQRNIKPLGR